MPFWSVMPFNQTSESSGTLFPSSASDSPTIQQMPRPSPSCLSHHVCPPTPHRAGLKISVFFVGHPARCSARGRVGDRADSTHWPSCKSLFYGPCNDPPAGNLHSVALQIEPAASGSWHGWGGAGWLQEVAGDAETHIAWPCTHSPTHTRRHMQLCSRS